MSDQIIVMSEGQIQQVAPPEELYDYPRNRFVANFIGSANLLSGRVDDSTRVGNAVEFVLDNGSRVSAVDNRRFPNDDAAFLAIRSVYPNLSTSALDGGATNQWECKIVSATFSGEFIEYLIETLWGQLIVRRPPTDRFRVSSAAVLTINPERCVVIEA